MSATPAWSFAGGGIFIESNSLHKPPAFFPREIDMIGVV